MPTLIVFMGLTMINLLLVGDVVLKKGSELKLSDDLRQTFNTADLVCGNLEAPETKSTKPLPKAGPSLKQRSGTIAALKRLGFDYLSLANNHIMDYGQKGAKDTLMLCRKQKIMTSGLNVVPARLVKNGLKIAIFSLAEQEFGSYALLYGTTVDQAIMAERLRSDLVIVYAHGGFEECPLPALHIRNRYRQLIKLGANLVIGSHPHVPQSYERHKGGYIFYSLGNFTIGFSPDEPRNEWSLVVEVKLQGEKIKKINVRPIYSTGGVISFFDHKRTKECLEVLRKISHSISSDRAFKRLINYQWQFLFEDRYERFLQAAQSQKLLMYLLMMNESHREAITQFIIGLPSASILIKRQFQKFFDAVNDYAKIE